MKSPVTRTLTDIAGVFKSLNHGRVTEETSHDWAREAVEKISLNPAEVTDWLILADRLAEEGNPAEHLIRLLFVPGYAGPEHFEGVLYRGGRYMENGQHYAEGIYLSYHWNQGWKSHGWRMGTRDIRPAEARRMAAQEGGQYCDRWLEFRAEGKLPPGRLALPADTEVLTAKTREKLEDAPRRHAVRETIEIPKGWSRGFMRVEDRRGTYTAIEFEYRGWLVKAPIDAVCVS